MATSYGAALPDCEPLVHSRVSSYLSLLPSFSSFLQSVSSESANHSQKLSSVIGNYRKQCSTSARERGGEGSTLEVGLAGVLEQMDLGVREYGTRAERQGREVGHAMGAVGSRLDLVRKRHHEHYKRLLSERDRVYEQREKSKSTYYSACQAVESARQKKAAAATKESDKLNRAYEQAVQEMGLAKNQYLLDIDLSNVAKDKLYNQHLPSVHDDYQLLEHSTTLQFVQLVDKMLQIEQESLDRLKSSVEKAKEELQKVQPERDQEMFVDRESRIKLQAWEVPPDAVFEECSVWHDTEDFSTSPASITYLQNVQLKATTRLAELSPAFETKRREIGGLRNLRETYEQQPGLGDTLGVIENLFTTQHETTLLEISQTEQSCQVELISATLGDSASTGLRPHEFKSSHFVTPSTCVVCEASVWGKGIKCEKCSMVAHSKCELKVPAGCSARPGAGMVRHKSKKSDAGPPSATMSNLSLNRSTSSAGSVSTVASSSAPPPRRSVPPPAGAASKTNPSAVLLYDYVAATAFELTVSEGDAVEVVEGEDDSGWTKVRVKRDGREGLVPGSYLQLDTPRETSARTVVALYDYTPAAGATDELAIAAGETASLVGKGTDYGEGWAEVEIVGKGRGIVPASYIATSRDASLNPARSFQGYCLSSPTYDALRDACTITLVSPRPHRAVAIVHVRGTGAKLIDERVKARDKVCLSCRGGQRVDALAQPDSAIPVVEIAFQDEVSGWIQRKDGRDEFFSTDDGSKVVPRKRPSGDDDLERERPSPIIGPRLTHGIASSLSKEITKTENSRVISRSSFVPYASLSEIKSGKLKKATRNFAVVVVGVNDPCPPRPDKPSDPWCARFDVTDLSLCPDSLSSDSLDSVVELQWYERDRTKLPTFREKDVILVRSIYVTDHGLTRLRAIRRGRFGPPCPVAAIPSSILVDRSLQREPLVFKNTKNPPVPLSRDELELATSIARHFHGKELPLPGTFRDLRNVK